uniref:Methyltransferase n=2 Tax=Caenorhabditis tropicalis TaxID=1561998 RepID=A0A1I7TQ73_9PELO
MMLRFDTKTMETSPIYAHWQQHYEDHQNMMKCCVMPKIDPYFGLPKESSLIPKMEPMDPEEWAKTFKGNEESLRF